MKTIRKLKRLEETTLRLGGSGDNWHMTWATDDKMFVSLCDGFGFPGTPRKDYNSRAYAICGDPPAVTFEYLPDYPDLVNTWGTTDSSRYYNFAILAIDETIYQFLSTPNRPFHESQPRFVGVKLISSPDRGKTWCNQDGSTPVRWESWGDRTRDNMLFFEESADAFSLPVALQMGKNYSLNRDGFVYLYSPNGNTEGTMNQLVLCRVARDQIRNRRAYEFFVSRCEDGKAVWSPHIEDRGIVHSFPDGWVNRIIHPYAWQPSVVYFPSAGEYLMANWGMGCDAQGNWFHKPSYLGFWTASTPWGPWRQIHEETAWMPVADRNARAYQPQIAPKWISSDGTSFWLVWTDFQTIKGERPYYSFNVQKVMVDIGG